MIIRFFGCLRLSVIDVNSGFTNVSIDSAAARNLNLANLRAVHLRANIIMYTSRCNHIAIVNANPMDLKSNYIIIWLGKLVHHLYVLQIASAEKLKSVRANFSTRIKNNEKLGSDLSRWCKAWVSSVNS